MSLKAVYASDKISAEICSRMQVVGFGWDPDRARQFSSYLKQIELDTMAVADSVVRPIKRGKSGGFSSNDLQRLFFEELRAPQLFFSDITGRPQLNVDALQAYSNGRNEALSKLSSAVLKFRRAQKLRATYIDGITVGSDGRVHASWQNYGTISGRWSCVAKGTPIEVLRDVAAQPKGVPIESVKPGDMAYCYINGKLAIRKVIKAESRGMKAVLRLYWRGAGNKHCGYLDVTPDHKLLTTSGQWVRADELRVGDRTYAMSRGLDAYGYVRIYATNQVGDRKEHRLVLPNVEVVHHKNGNKLDNRPENLEAMTFVEHAAEHEFGHAISDETRAKRVAYGKRPEVIARLQAAPRRKLELTHEEIHAALEQCNWSITKAAKLTGHDFQAYKDAAVRVGFDLKALKKQNRSLRKVNNHTITAIELLPGEVETFDLEIEEAHNFIAGELCVHNCSGPNLANLPRGVNDYTAPMGGIRSLYIARPGCVLVGYDKSQIEFRIASYGSGDEAMIAVCEGGDVHSMNASSLFADFIVTEYATFKKRIKAEDTLSPEEEARFVGLDGLRTLAKSAVFAICYLAEAPTVYQRIVASGVRGVTLRMVETMLANMKKKFAHYYKWQNARLLDCIRTGYVYSPILGRRRWLGHDPAPTEAANFPIQGGAADVMNAEIPTIFKAVRRDVPSAELVAHVYDSVYFDVPSSAAGLTQRICLDISLQPVTISSSGVARQMVLPVDMGVSDRWH